MRKSHYTKTTTKSDGRLDFYRESTYQTSYCAVTEFYVDSTRYADQSGAPTRD